MLTVSEATRRAELRIFGISEWSARQTATKPGDRSVVAGDGITHMVAVKDHGERTLLVVVVEKQGQPPVIDGVYPVPATVQRGPTPLDTLVALCERYGVPIPLEGERPRLVIAERIKGRPEPFLNRTVTLMKKQGKPGHEYTGVSSIRPMEGYTDIAFFFILDLTAIAEDTPGDNPPVS